MTRQIKMNNYSDNSNLSEQVTRLNRLRFYTRWLLVLTSWLTLVPFGIWQMRETVSLCQQYCTWAAIRYGLEFNPLGAMALCLSLAITTSTLIWHSCYILEGGLSSKEKYYLQQKVMKIKSRGSKHILYKLIFPK